MKAFDDPQYDKPLQKRVKALRKGISQPYAILSNIDKGMTKNPSKYRRILLGRVFPGDEPLVEQMEQAREKLNTLN